MAKKAKWRRHTVEFKHQVVERMKTCQNIHALARELKIERKLLYTWKYQFEGRPGRGTRIWESLYRNWRLSIYDVIRSRAQVAVSLIV
jgi:transposase-like protein